MITFHRICIKSHTVTAQNGDTASIERGEEYLTSAERDGAVVVFSTSWCPFPKECFAGEEPFTIS